MTQPDTSLFSVSEFLAEIKKPVEQTPNDYMGGLIVQTMLGIDSACIELERIAISNDVYGLQARAFFQDLER